MNSNQPSSESAALGLLTLASTTKTKNLSAGGAGAGDSKNAHACSSAKVSTSTNSKDGKPVRPPEARRKKISAPKKAFASQQDEVLLGTIDMPTTSDILSGRGNGANQHPGNIFFRSLVNRFKARYVLSAPSEKKRITRQVLGIIQERNPPGRFLKQDHANELWYELNREHALKKTAQALREKAPELKKKVSLGLLEEASTNKAKNANTLISKAVVENNEATTNTQAQNLLRPARGLLQHEIKEQRLARGESIALSREQQQQERCLPQKNTDPQDLNETVLYPSAVSPQIPCTSKEFLSGNSDNNGCTKNRVGVEDQAVTATTTATNSDLPLACGNPLTQSHHVTNQNQITQTPKIAKKTQEFSGPAAAKITQFPKKDLPFTCNYKTVSILSAEMSSTCGLRKRRNTNCDNENECLKNIATVASTNCDLTALYLIIRMSSNSFKGFQWADIIPKNSDVLVDGVIHPNHPGNIRLVDAIQGYRTEYLGAASVEIKNDIEKQIYACIVTKNPSNSNPPGRFLQRARDSNWKKLSPKEAIVVIRSLLEQSCSYILNADANDILFGGDLRSKSSPGTMFFKAVIQRCKPLFLQSPPDRQMHYVAELVGFATTRPARFLGYIPQMGMWRPLSFETAMKKTREALGDNTTLQAQLQIQVQSQPQFQTQQQLHVHPHALPESHLQIQQSPRAESPTFDNEITLATNHAVQIHHRRSSASQVNRTMTFDNKHSCPMDPS